MHLRQRAESPARVPLSRCTALTRHIIRDKTLKNFGTATTEQCTLSSMRPLSGCGTLRHCAVCTPMKPALATETKMFHLSEIAWKSRNALFVLEGQAKPTEYCSAGCPVQSSGHLL